MTEPSWIVKIWGWICETGLGKYIKRAWYRFTNKDRLDLLEKKVAKLNKPQTNDPLQIFPNGSQFDKISGTYFSTDGTRYCPSCILKSKISRLQSEKNCWCCLSRDCLGRYPKNGECEEGPIQILPDYGLSD